MQQVTNRDGEVVDVLEASDLQPWVDAMLGRLTARLMFAILAAVVSVAAGWATLKADSNANAREIQRVDRMGSEPVQTLRGQVDSLRIELRHVPGDVVAELRRQGVVR